MRSSKILDLDGLRHLRSQYPNSKIVHCHGVFDVLHPGHLAYFESAKKNGDILVVTLTDDQFVNKGPGRPHFSAAIRAEMAAALQIVDHVAISKFQTAEAVIEALRPHFYVKGPDYREKSRDLTGAIYNEEAAVKKHGGVLVFTDDETHSSSNLLNKFFSRWSENQSRCIERVIAAGGMEAIEKVLDRISKSRVSVIGESIIDTYIFCSPENISSKSPSISAKFVCEENYAGGSLAIANHLSDFVSELTLFTTHGGEPLFLSMLKEKMDPRVEVVGYSLENVPTPRKTRFIAVEKAQRIFEVTDLRSDQWSLHSPKALFSKIAAKDSADRIEILADFGHGFFENSMLSSMSELKGFIGLNVQTNSSNFGFNPYTKHKRFSYLSIDTKEARVAYHDRMRPPLELANRLHQDLSAMKASCSMTLGSDGAYFYPCGSDAAVHAPAFTDSVVDATGAGDAYFALTSMLVSAKCPDVFVPFLGNVFAGLKTKIMGNKSSVTRAQLLKAVGSILK